MTFEVEDIERTWNFLLNRQATPITESSMHGRTEVATGTSASRHPLETLRSGFVQKTDFEGFAPGFESVAVPRGRR